MDRETRERMRSQVYLNSDVLWRSIDAIAEMNGLSLPKLALKAGLDQSTFSHARRRRNWMSLQTLAKVLNHYDIDIEEWSKMVKNKARDKQAA
jgi:transcriptional regulator with XRE-family HTH domain